MSWPAIEDALHLWITNASGLAGDHVVWAIQNTPLPTGPFISLRIGEIVAVSTVDAVEVQDNPSPSPGAEILLSAQGLRSFRLSVEAFNCPPLGDSSGRALLSKVRAALSLPSNRDALAAAGVSPFDLGNVNDISAVQVVNFEARAHLDVGFYMMETASETATYIETVETEDFTGPPASGTRDAIDIP